MVARASLPARVKSRAAEAAGGTEARKPIRSAARSCVNPAAKGERGARLGPAGAAASDALVRGDQAQLRVPLRAGRRFPHEAGQHPRPQCNRGDAPLRPRPTPATSLNRRGRSWTSSLRRPSCCPWRGAPADSAPLLRWCYAPPWQQRRAPANPTGASRNGSASVVPSTVVWKSVFGAATAPEDGRSLGRRPGSFRGG